MRHPPSNTDDLVKRFQDILRQGNMRRLVIKSAEGHTLIETSLTVVAIIVFFLLITRVIVIAAILGIIAGVVAKIQVEIIQEASANTTVVDTEETTTEPATENGRVEIPTETIE